jgi:hypothetical protein
MCDSFGAIWAIELGKATSYIFDGIISLLVVLNKSNSCYSELPSHRVILELFVRLNVSSAAWGKLWADAIIISMMWLVTKCGWQDIVFVVRGISVLALHLPLQLLRAEVYLKHEVIL